MGAAAVLLAAAELYALIARKVATKEAEPTDQSVHQWAQEHRTAPLDIVTKPITLLSIPLVVVSATAVLVWWLHHQDRKDAVLAIAFTPLAAAALGQSFTSFFAQRNPPDHPATGTGEPTEATFPSGHTTGVTAEALAIAYILSREKLASPGVLAALLAWPVVVGVTRLYRDRHWLSDVLAGWVGGRHSGRHDVGAAVSRVPAPQRPGRRSATRSIVVLSAAKDLHFQLRTAAGAGPSRCSERQTLVTLPANHSVSCNRVMIRRPMSGTPAKLGTLLSSRFVPLSENSAPRAA